MEVKGNIGEEVYVKARITGITVDESGTQYFTEIINGDGDKCLHWVNSSDVQFIKKDVIREPVNVPAPAKLEIPEANHEKKPWESGFVPSKPKKRGRPKKATVEDLIMKAKEDKDGEEI